MPATLGELEARVAQLSVQVAALATKTQLDNLLAALNTYKTDTDARLNTLTGTVDAHERRLNDLEGRVQTLEP